MFEAIAGRSSHTQAKILFVTSACGLTRVSSRCMDTMSKKNIISKSLSEDGKSLQVTFENEDGHRLYEYRGQSMRAVQRGRDPGGLSGGKFIKHIPKKG